MALGGRSKIATMEFKKLKLPKLTPICKNSNYLEIDTKPFSRYAPIQFWEDSNPITHRSVDTRLIINPLALKSSKS